MHAILLTYAQAAALDIKSLVKFFITDFDNHWMDIYLAKELHKLGSVHYHVLLVSHKKMRYQSMKRFDVDEHHPNIARIEGDLTNVISYVKKDGDWLFFNNYNCDEGWPIMNACNEIVPFNDWCCMC